MKKKSLGVIAILNAINTVLGMLFPLITYPYITRVLGVENLGKINFSSAVVSYFALLSALGIYTYASREGAIVREDKKLFGYFANEVFTINCLSMCITYVIQFIMLFSVHKLKEYALLIFIQSLSILFTTIGVSWIYTIYEDYIYIVCRNVVFQIVSLVLLFCFVRTKDDYVIYTIIMAISSGGSNILNFFHARKYVKLKIVKFRKCLKHIKSILIIFASSIASTIYVNSDNIILGFMWGDSPVGLYSIAVKIYSILKTLVNAVLGVALPRVTLLFSLEKHKEANDIIYIITQFLIFLIAPIVVGINILCNEVLYIVGGKQYLLANMSLRILMIAFVFSIFASLYSTLILLPKKHEKIIAVASTISALVNIVLNFFFIKFWKQNGAAFTTAISEIIVCCIYFYYSKKISNVAIEIKEIVKVIFASVLMIPLSWLIKTKISNMVIYTASIFLICGFEYVLCLILLKSASIQNATNWIKTKYKGGKYNE